MAGTILAVPAIGLTAIFAVLRFTNFALASHMTIGAFAGFVANATFGLPMIPALVVGLENSVRFAFGIHMRGYDLPLRRDWRFAGLHVSSQQVESLLIAIVV